MINYVILILLKTNIKVFNQISRLMKQDIYLRLDASACNDKQSWNNDKNRFECKELIYKGRWDERFIWNPRKCGCECDKSCDLGNI